MDTAEVLRRALHEAVAPIDGEVAEQMRTRCRHVMAADYADRLKTEMGADQAALGARQAARLLAHSSPRAAQFLTEIADLLDPGTTTAAPVTPGTADPTSTASSTSPEGTS